MLRIDCKFPGGNIKVHEIQGDTVFISPDLRGASVPWFYWAFRISGAEGRTLVFRFISDFPVGTRGPAVSTDGRKSWHWTHEAWDQGSFRLTVPCGIAETFVAFSPVYTQENWDAFLANPRLAEAVLSDGTPVIANGSFAMTRNGRQVEILHVGAAADKAARHVVVTARHNSSAMIANPVMEGMILEIALGESDEAKLLRENVSFSFVPFVDKDGVEEGDQGRGRRPHDFSVDYGENKLYPETAAVRGLCGAIISRFGKLDLFLDLKSPWIRGGDNETVHFAGKPELRHAELLGRFGEKIEKCISASSLPFSSGERVESEREIPREGTLSALAWASSQSGIHLAAALGIPYATVRDTEVTWDRARLFGAAVAKALI